MEQLSLAVEEQIILLEELLETTQSTQEKAEISAKISILERISRGETTFEELRLGVRELNLVENDNYDLGALYTPETEIEKLRTLAEKYYTLTENTPQKALEALTCYELLNSIIENLQTQTGTV